DAPGDGRRRHPHRRHDPQDRGLPPRSAQRCELGPPARWSPAPRRAAGALQRRRRGHHDHGGGATVSAVTPASNPLMPTYPPPAVTFVRGEGAWLWDDEGTRYLDLLSGLAVTSLGHSHPAVQAALTEQAGT